MTVRDPDLRNALAALGCVQYGVEMRQIIWPGVDDRNLAVAQKIGIGAALGHWRGVVGTQQPQAVGQDLGGGY